ncbi:MAG: hypothetical protein Ct9H300mP17_14630 [Candidatus Nitrosopelagicus sp.]|nr:MAG: hypothetical protein Ct9H300mP17_14630 [Candidatus Nitrosopelagicus sp.]
MVVTGRADISVILNSSIDEINNVVIDLKNVKEIVNTETLIEVEVIWVGKGSNTCKIPKKSL